MTNKLVFFRKSQIFLILLILIFAIASCSRRQPLRIAVSKASGSEHYLNYPKWLRGAGDVEIVDMISLSPVDAVKALEGCSGLVLTGGPDIDPGRYGKEFDTARCEMDLKRDTLEFALIQKALSMKIPILGICRGEQILNVAMLGSLIVDIPSDYGISAVHRTDNPPYPRHDITISKGSILEKICSVDSGIVNSSHHQAVERLADSFRAIAHSKDNLIEAFGWKQPNGKPFLLAVQWHPERLEENNPLSLPIAKYFLEQAGNYAGAASK